MGVSKLSATSPLITKTEKAVNSSELNKLNVFLKQNITELIKNYNSEYQ